MTPEEHAAWLEGVRQWARERAERGEEERAPPPWNYTTTGFAEERAARLRLALVRDDTSPDGWRLADLEEVRA